MCVYSAYETLQLPPPTTASDGTEMYSKVQRPAMLGVHDNSSAAVTATDATAAGDDNDDYEIPIPTDVAPSRPHA